jgi:hypothetical protein
MTAAAGTIGTNPNIMDVNNAGPPHANNIQQGHNKHYGQWQQQELTTITMENS